MEGHSHHRRSRVLRRDAHAHIHEHMKREIETQVEVVYVTASNTLGGKVVGYETLDGSASATSVQVKTATTATPTTPTTTQAKTTTTAQAKTTTAQAKATTAQAKTTTTPKTTAAAATTKEKETTSEITSEATTEATSEATTEAASPTTTEEIKTTASSIVEDDTPITTAESTTSSQTTFSTRASSARSISSTVALESATGTLASATSSSTAVPASSGMSTTTTVGLIAGAAAILLVIGAFAAFFYRRKAQKKMAAAYGKTEDEKRGPAGAGGHGIPYNEKADDVPLSASDRAPRVSLRPVTQFLPNLMTTPAATTTTTASTVQQRISTPSTGISASAISETRKAPPPALNLVTSDNAASSPSTGGFTTAPIVAPSMVSPTSSTFTDVATTPAAIAANGGIGPNPVHRVQMDFKPSMGDELELRAGALVRLLHEYDDGWALCIRLDRSQQGVCPRTCLSQRPVKPRPHGPPGSPPQGRTGYSSGPNSRPQSPAGNGPIRPYSPAGGPRSQSPGPNSRNFTPQSPGVGYVKAQYRPAGETAPKVESVPSTPITSAPSSPITKAPPPPSLRVGPPPQITISTAPDSRPSSPSGSRPQSPVNMPSPQFAPVKPSPLSNEQRASIVAIDEPVIVGQPAAANSEQVAFHAM